MIALRTMLSVDKRVLHKLRELDTRNAPVKEMTRYYEESLQGQLNDDNMEKMYNKAISLFQGLKVSRGKSFEEAVEHELSASNIPYLRQATIDPDGNIVATSKNKKGMRKPDIIINAKVGDNIRDKIIISMKYSLRERKYEDTSVAQLCKQLYLLTVQVKNEEREYEELLKHNIHLVVVDGKHTLDECFKNIINITTNKELEV